MTWSLAAGGVALATVLVGCSATAAAPAPPRGPLLSTPAATSPASPQTGTPTRDPGVDPPTTAATPPSPRAPTSAPPDTRGANLDTPYVVGGVLVVNREHRLGPGYVPAWSTQPYGLRPDVRQAAERLMGASRKAGLPLSIRSGYRAYAVQDASFRRAMRTYGEAVARAYYAEAGTSEHQTGLALDVWDGRHRGDAFKKTRQAAWVAQHAHEYGFVVRYPDGRQNVTGYQWEPWHLRYVGPAIAAKFGPNSSLTLEEYLGVP